MLAWRSSSLRRVRSLFRTLFALFPRLPAFKLGGGPLIAQAVVLRPGRAGPEVALVLRTSPRAWELPGGSVEEGEAPEEAVVREVEEETGLVVRVERLVGTYRRTGFIPHRSPVYACRFERGMLRGNFESVALAWFPVDALPPGLFPWYVPVVRDAAAGVTHTEEQVQRLGWRAVGAALNIHLRTVLGLMR